MTIGERIKARRQFLGMSQEELSEIAGYKSRTSINKIESGKSDVSRAKLELLAMALETTVSFLLGERTLDDLEEEERRIILLYRAASPEIQEAVMRIVRRR